MVQAITTPLAKMGQLFCRVLTKTGQAVRLVASKVGQAVRRVVRKTVQAVGLVVTKMVQAVRWVLTEVGRALRWVMTKVGQAVTWVLTKMGRTRSHHNESTRQTRVRTPVRFAGGNVAGKPQSQGSPVFSDSRDYRIDIPKYRRDYCIDIPVDNDDEHRMVALRKPLLSEDEANAPYDVVCYSPTPPVAVPTKHQLEAAIGSPVGKDVARFTDVVAKSSMLPMAAPEVSYKQVVKQASLVMVGNLSTLSEPKPRRFGKHGGYDGGQRILLVGEGDFSFSACLASAFGDASNMVATSLDTIDFLKKNYKKAPENIKELKGRGCEVIHRVDATKMVNHPKLCSIQFDRIIYNFPHSGFSKLNEPRGVQISYHQSLVSGFMANAKRMIDRGNGEIHITHKCVGFSKDWNIVQLGHSEGLGLAGEVEFKLRKYPGYCTKYGFGGDRDFNCYPSKTYTFKLAPKKKSWKKRKN